MMTLEGNQTLYLRMSTCQDVREIRIIPVKVKSNGYAMFILCITSEPIWEH